MTITDRKSGSASASTVSARLGGIPDGLGIKAPVYLATTANITLSGLQTIDGVTLTEGKRVLVKDQNTASENGIYDATSGNWTRSADMATNGDVVEGTRVWVTDGTVNAQTEWVVTSADDITIDTTNIVFSALATPGGGTLASQAQAEAGVENTTFMSPLRTKQAIQNGTYFTHASSGVTARTFTAKISEIQISVKDYGAVGDGSTDDTTAIAAAVSACAGLGGGIVYFPPGNYKISSTLTINQENVVLIGAGGDSLHDGGSGVDGATKLTWDGSPGGTMVKFATAYSGAASVIYGVGMEGFEFNGASSAGIGLLVDTVRNGKFRNIFVTNVTDDCFKITCGITSTDTGEAADTQECIFEQLSFRVIDSVTVQSANGFNLTGSSNANTSLNTFIQCKGQHYNGAGFIIKNADNNILIRCGAFNAGGSGYTFDFWAPGASGSGSVGGICNILYGCSWANTQGVIFRGTEQASSTSACVQNQIIGYDKANSAGNPDLGTGASYLQSPLVDSSTGLIVQTSATGFTKRTLTGTASRVTVTNGDGVSGNPTFTLPDDVTITSLTVDDEAYDATGWNGDLTVPTKNAVRDKIEALSLGGGGASTALDNLSAVAINAALVLGTSDAFALGSATKMWSDLFLASGAVINFNNGNYTLTHSAGLLTTSGPVAFGGGANGAAPTPRISMGSYADNSGNPSISHLDLYNGEFGLGISGGLLNYITGSGAAHAFYTSADLSSLLFRINATSVGFGLPAQPLSNDGAALGVSGTAWSDLFLASGAVINFNAGDVTLTHSSNLLAFAGASSGYTFDAAVTPASSDGAALGSASVMWSDAFFASGAVLNFNNGDVTLTHSSNSLAIAGVDTLFSVTGANTSKYGFGTETNPQVTMVLSRAGAAAAPAILTHDTALQITGSDNATAVSGLFASAHGSTITGAIPTVSFRSTRGTAASPTATQSSDQIGRFGGGGYGTSQYSTTDDAGIFMIALENYTNTAHGSAITFNAKPTGSDTRAEIGRAAGGGAWTFPLVGTTASAANAYLDNAASNNLLRSTSSLRYKTDVEPVDVEIAKSVLDIEPIFYRSIAPADLHDNGFGKTYYGYAAEDVAKIDPRLVSWGYRQDDMEYIETEDGEGVRYVPREGADKVPDGVMYDRVLLLQIHALKARVAALEVAPK